jgi:16S rRNA (cytosine967-C5)-methyltransferase
LKLAASADLTQAGNLRLWPHLHATDGFFAAIWQKS